MKKITINDFTPVIAWQEIRLMLGEKRYKKFEKWMIGQTCTHGGVYPSDLERYLLGLPILD